MQKNIGSFTTIYREYFPYHDLRFTYFCLKDIQTTAYKRDLSVIYVDKTIITHHINELFLDISHQM